MSKDQGITPQRGRDHFTVTEKDGDDGGFYIPTVHHPYTAPGFDEPAAVDPDWDDGPEGPVDDPEPGHNGETLFS
jgi:hypothetical protein